MHKCLLFRLFAFLIILSGCGTVRSKPKYQFADGYYSTKPAGEKRAKVYIDNAENIIQVYTLQKDGQQFKIDTSLQTIRSFPQQQTGGVVQNLSFSQASFDVDFLTIPFKYRPQTAGFPRQFNTNLNGAVYAGYRNDMYKLSYRQNPLGQFERHITHYGFSIGVFTGMGGTAMNPSVTNNQITSEYDGVVWSKGLAGIMGINNFTIGMALGWDDLLDSNKKYWIYKRKPWIGLAFGLNLN